MNFVCKENKPCSLTAHALGKTVTITGDVPEKAIHKPMTDEALRARLSKLGGTQFYAGSISIDLDDGLILPASAINAMRRRATEAINETSLKTVEAKPLDIILPKNQSKKNNKPYATAVFASTQQIPEKHPFKRIFIPLSSENKYFSDKSVGAVLPAGMFGCEERIAKRLTELKSIGVENILCSNIGGYRLAEKMGFKVFGDFGLNIFNSESANLIQSPILSFELTLAQTNRINASDTGIIAYGNVPLMLTRNCPVKNDIGCKKCGGNGSLTDRKGYVFPVTCSDYPCAEVLNCLPIYMLDRLDEIKTDFIHFYFSRESREQVEQAYKSAGS